MAKTNKTTNDVKIQKNNNGRWVVIKDGNKNPSKIVNTQREAITEGRTIAKKTGAQMIIYNEQGTERRRYYQS